MSDLLDLLLIGLLLAAAGLVVYYFTRRWY